MFNYYNTRVGKVIVIPDLHYFSAIAVVRVVVGLKVWIRSVSPLCGVRSWYPHMSFKKKFDIINEVEDPDEKSDPGSWVIPLDPFKQVKSRKN